MSQALCKTLERNDAVLRRADVDAIVRHDPSPGRLGLPRQRSRARAAVNLLFLLSPFLAAGLWLAGVRP